ncbi:MAG: (Fe-S)-binding protein [Pseudomonadota bacterium]|nr:MAG: (Fe-S)-binding protein [Pseudomonadota bacterium]
MTMSLPQGVNALVNVIDRPIAAYFNSCVHCGFCAEACLFYTETGDPRYTPIHKVEPLRKVWKQNFTFWGRLLRALGLSKPLTLEELKEWQPLVYDACTMCGRCSTVCPLGNDITYMIRKLREGMVAAGAAPEDLEGAAFRTLTVGSPMQVTLETIKATIRHTEKETGIKVPLDQEGAEVMMLLSSNEVGLYPEIMPALARVFDKAKVSWTLCSTAYEATNAGIQIGSSDVARTLVQRIVDGAERLRVKIVISPECGHAYTALRWDGPNLIGRPYGFKVLHITEFLDQLRAEGRLTTSGKESKRITYHDPCQIARRGGVVEPPRNLIKMVADNFVEMDETGTANWCCGGGGGVSSIERAIPLRRRVFSKKKSQLDAINVKKVVTTCANCRHMIEDGVEYNKMDVEVVSLTEMLAEHVQT